MKLFRRATLVLAAVAVATIGLAGCVGTPEADNHNTTTPSPDASSSPSASATSPAPSATPTAAVGGKPVTIACNALISAQTMYDFNPNFGLDTASSPKSGSAAATAVADHGVACNWLNQTSSDTITVSVARPGPTALDQLKSTAARGAAASGYGDAAYFSTNGDAGRVDVFTGEYWLVATSVYFASAADAAPLLTSALGALK